MTDIDPDVIQYYENYLAMFDTDGWKAIIKDLQESLVDDQRTAVSRCETGDDWLTEKGRQQRSIQFIQFETGIRNAYEQLMNPSPLPDEEDSEE
jgi:hypothetical protein